MGITKSREEFEKWASEEFNDLSRGIYTGSSECVYLDSEVEYCWKAWQSSRESIKVILPPAINTEEIGKAISKEITMARLAIVGIRIKGESE